MIVASLIILVLSIERINDCTRPAYVFFVGYIFLHFLRFIQSGLYYYWILQRKNGVKLLLSKYLFLKPLLTGWLIYGNVVFYGQRARCGEALVSSSKLYTFLLIVIIVGYFQMFLFFIISTFMGI